MIRIVTIGALLCLLVLVLYLPSAHPPAQFLAQVRVDQQSMAQLWGDEPALRILDRALSIQGSARDVSPLPSATNAPNAGGVNGAVAQQMAAVNLRLFDNPYFRSIDALVFLAAYRLSTLLEWLPWVLVFATAALADGAIRRAIKSKEFGRHDPELFALNICLAILLLCCGVIGLVLPVELHPLAMPAMPVLVSALVGRAVAHFHRRA